jgi:hypothetical protein
MALTDKPRRPDAREVAEAAVQRAAAQRELQTKLDRIEVLRTVSGARFARIRRTIVVAAVWLGLLALVFGAFVWFWPELSDWLTRILGLADTKPGRS